MKQLLLHLEETKELGRTFVIQDLDETHIFIAEDVVDLLKDRLDDFMDQLQFSEIQSNQ